MENKNTRGGARSNAGRKPAKNKKIPLFIYVPQDQVDALGRDTIKVTAEKAIERKFRNSLK